MVHLYEKPSRLKYFLRSILDKKQLELESALCRVEGVRGESWEPTVSSRRWVGGEVCVSSWSLANVGKGEVVAGGNERVAWSCKNGWEEVLSGWLNHFSLYNSILSGFYNGFTMTPWVWFRYIVSEPSSDINLNSGLSGLFNFRTI